MGPFTHACICGEIPTSGIAGSKTMYILIFPCILVTQISDNSEAYWLKNGRRPPLTPNPCLWWSCSFFVFLPFAGTSLLALGCSSQSHPCLPDPGSSLLPCPACFFSHPLGETSPPVPRASAGIEVHSHI